MRKVLIVVAMAGLLCWGLAGCGGEGQSEDAAKILTAQEIESEVRPMVPMQSKCPVCDGSPIDPDIHADYENKRIYFDKQECLDKFNADKEKYVTELRQKMMQMMGGPPPGGGAQ